MGNEVNPNEFLGILLNNLTEVLSIFQDTQFSSFKDEWISYHAYHDRPVKLILGNDEEVEGRVSNISSEGSLVIQTDKGERFFTSGEISIKEFKIMYLLIDIGNTRIKWQQRDDKDILLTDSILVEEFMDIDFSSIKSIDKIIVSNVNHSVVLDKLKEILSKFKCPIIEATPISNEYLINDYEDQYNFRC